jgi:hypothetical protein
MEKPAPVKRMARAVSNWVVRYGIGGVIKFYFSLTISRLPQVCQKICKFIEKSGLRFRRPLLSGQPVIYPNIYARLPPRRQPLSRQRSVGLWCIRIRRTTSALRNLREC